jgi:C-terminal processing protease CtpA/Prc
VGEDDTIYYTAVPKVSFGDIELNNQVVSFKGNEANTMGNEFFENYDVTYNWFEKEMILTDKKKADISSFNSFGFTYFFSEDKLIVSLVIQGSTADLKGIKRGEQIIEINGESYIEMNLEKWCELLDKNILRTSEIVEIKILRNGEEISYQLEKTNLLK